MTIEETPQHGDRKALAAIADQPLLYLEQREVRAAPDQAQQIVAMGLDPAGAPVAARRRGFVTLPCREREVSVPQELSGRCDRGAPRVHRRGAKRAVRLG